MEEILSARDIVRQHLNWIIGNDSFLPLWFDNWCLGRTLRSHFIGPLEKQCFDQTLNTITTESQSGALCWDLVRLDYLLPSELGKLILPIPLPVAFPHIDTPFWPTKMSIVLLEMLILN